jgi:hypothetical protein
MTGAREALQAAVTAALEGAGVTAFDAPPVRGALPHAVVEEPSLRDWSAATWTGREGVLVVAFHDAGERPVRLRATIEAGEAAVAAIGPALGGGWRVAQLRLQRSRVARKGERWLGTSEFLVRIYRENG